MQHSTYLLERHDKDGTERDYTVIQPSPFGSTQEDIHSELPLSSAFVSIDLAAEGARIAARLVRDQRLRDMLAAIAEFWRASGPDRTYWRSQGAFLIREWRRIYEHPERAAFQAAVAASKRRAAA